MFKAVTHRFAVGDRVRWTVTNWLGTVAVFDEVGNKAVVAFDGRCECLVSALWLVLVLRAVPAKEIHISQNALALAALGDDCPAPPNDSVARAFWLLIINGMLRELEG